MTQNKKLRTLVQKMIAEAVSHRIKSIDEAGDIAANEAKITRISEELNKANKISELLEKINLQHYIGEKLYSKVKEEMTKSIQEYEGAKLELEERASGKDTNTDKKDKKKKNKDNTEKVLELNNTELNETTNIISGNFNKKINSFLKVNGLKMKHSPNQDHSDVNNSDLWSGICEWEDCTYPLAKFYYKIGKLEYPSNGKIADMVKNFDFN